MNRYVIIKSKIHVFLLAILVFIASGTISKNYGQKNTVFPQEKIDKICFESRRGSSIPSLQHSTMRTKFPFEMQGKHILFSKGFIESRVPSLEADRQGDLYIGPDYDTVFIVTDYVQEGDIIIFGDGILVVDNAKLTLSGQLWIQDQGQALFRNNAHLHYNQFYVGQYYAWLLDRAPFEASDATVDANGVMHFVQLHDNSTYMARRTTFPDWTFRKVFDSSTLILEDVDYVGDLLVDDSCSVHFTRCDTLMPWFETPDGSIIDIQFPAPDAVDHFEFSEATPGVDGVGFTFIVDDCRECWWSMETFPGCSVVVNNSIIRGSCFRIPSSSNTFSIEGIANYDMHSDLNVPLHDRHVQYVNTYVYWWNWYPMDQTVFYMDSCVFGEMIGKGGSEIYAARSTHSGHTILLGSIDSAFVSFTDGLSQAFVGSWNASTLLLVNSSVLSLMPYQSTNLAHGNSYFLAVNSSFDYEPEAMDTALVMFAAIEGPDTGSVEAMVYILGSAWTDAGPQNPTTFDHYRLYWSPVEEPSWMLIAESTGEIHHDILGTWNTLGIDEGDYDLRLTVWDNVGDSLTAFKSITMSHILCTKGDVNGDGAINVLDVVMTVNIILENHDPTPEQFEAADMNGDGAVDVLDVVAIVGIILGTSE
ncbi:MAG: dockerin type I repeat-containing protein [Gemmatimonadota bacterium]|nr:MAG: dockerin type I repeat-containing protein [Gemmatimonadota bacterium]